MEKILLQRVKRIEFNDITGTFENSPLKGWQFKNNIKGIGAKDLAHISSILNLLNNSDFILTIKNLFIGRSLFKPNKK